MADRIYTRFGLKLINHVANKGSGNGSASTLWNGTITFETSEPIENEIDVERDLETLIHFENIKLFGKGALLTGIQFHWDSRIVGEGDDQTVQDFCRVSVNYMSSIVRVQRTEMLERLKAMGMTEINGMSLDGGQS